MLKLLYRNRYLRRLVLPILHWANRDITINHPWTGDDLRLNLFRHKGYWFHGKNRENREMQIFQQILSKDEIIAEVGGHIGYLSLWFSRQLGSGHVYVFEPGENNLPYLRKNIAPKANIKVIEVGCGELAGQQEFFQDNLTGQNNSFVPNFQGLSTNAKYAPGVVVSVKKSVVEVVRLDDYFHEIGVQPGFIKIDTEGFEWPVLKGCHGLFSIDKIKPKFMVEVQANHSEIYHLFSSMGYRIYNAAGIPVNHIEQMRGNLFMLHPDHHAREINLWIGSTT